MFSKSMLAGKNTLKWQVRFWSFLAEVHPRPFYPPPYCSLTFPPPVLPYTTVKAFSFTRLLITILYKSSWDSLWHNI